VIDNIYKLALYSKVIDDFMTEKNLITVSFPKKLLWEVDSTVKKSGKYLNRADFCRAAVRALLIKEITKLEIKPLAEVTA
jgi:Arc/MetJ-type ribon-helix-helix transcriptional regulator